MLKKVLGVNLVSKLWAILLPEVYFNGGNKLIHRNGMLKNIIKKPHARKKFQQTGIYASGLHSCEGTFL